MPYRPTFIQYIHTLTSHFDDLIIINVPRTCIREVLVVSIRNGTNHRCSRTYMRNVYHIMLVPRSIQFCQSLSLAVPSLFTTKCDTNKQKLSLRKLVMVTTKYWNHRYGTIESLESHRLAADNFLALRYSSSMEVYWYPSWSSGQCLWLLFLDSH